MNNFTFYQSSVRPEGGEIFIGSSDIPVIIKTRNSKIKKSNFELWEEKTGKFPSFDGNDFTTWGHELEPLLIAAYIRYYHDPTIAYEFKCDYVLHENYRAKTYIPRTVFYPFTECRHPQFDWALAHADCVYTENKQYLIEAKTGGYWARVKREDFEGFDLDDHTINGVPTDVLLQVQWQMLVYGVDLTYVLLLVDDNKFHVYTVPAIKKWWPLLIEKASRFLWHCKNDKPPQPEKFDDVAKLFPEIKDKAVYITGERAIIGEKMKQEYKKLTAQKKKIEKRINDIKDAAGLLMGENKYLYNGESGQKLFQQVITKDQFNPIHPSTILEKAPDAYKILEERSLINKHDRRYIR